MRVFLLLLLFFLELEQSDGEQHQRRAEGAAGRVRRQRDDGAAAVRGAGRQPRHGTPAVQQPVAGQRHRTGALRQTGAPATPHRRGLHAAPGTDRRNRGHALRRHWLGTQIRRSDILISFSSSLFFFLPLVSLI